MTNRMIVSMWMSRNPATVGLNTTAIEAARLMAERRVRRLLVAEHYPEGERLLGIISAKDVLHAFPPGVNPFAITGPAHSAGGKTVADIMTARPHCATPDEPIEDAAAVMCARKIGALPVLRDGFLAGIITESDIFRAFTSLFGSKEKGARITFDATRGEDVFELMGKFSKLHQLKISSLIWTRYDELPVCVVRVMGEGASNMVEELWNSGHAVVNVIHFDEPAEVIAPPAATKSFKPFSLPKPMSDGMYMTG